MSNATQPAALFPGQGSHTPEMRDLVAQRAPELLEKVIELVGEDPFARVEENTRFAQPAIFCASVVGWDALDLHPSAGAGHSLGELAALVAAGVLKRDDALELVVLRGRLMGEARNGSMLALVGASLEDAREIADAGGVTVANDNAPGQVVLSGSIDALDKTEEVAQERNTRVIRLDVAGAFHSPAMEPAAEPFRAALDEVEVVRAQLHRLLLRERRAVHRRARRARRRPDPARALAGDRHRHARSRSALLRGGRPRQGPRPDGEANPQGRAVRDPSRRTCPCLAPRSPRS